LREDEKSMRWNGLVEVLRKATNETKDWPMWKRKAAGLESPKDSSSEQSGASTERTSPERIELI
jgi:hypothetical protein